MTTFSDLTRLEDAALRREAIREGEGRDRAARYSCRWCGSAYALFCINPVCPASGWIRPHFAIVRPQYKCQGWERDTSGNLYPRGWAAERRAIRKAAREAENETTRQHQAELWEATSKAVKAWKAEHPSRKFAIVEIPTLQEETRYYIIGGKNDDFSLPRRLIVGWETVRVCLADGSYKPSDGQPEVSIRRWPSTGS